MTPEQARLILDAGLADDTRDPHQSAGAYRQTFHGEAIVKVDRLDQPPTKLEDAYAELFAKRPWWKRHHGTSASMRVGRVLAGFAAGFGMEDWAIGANLSLWTYGGYGPGLSITIGPASVYLSLRYTSYDWEMD